MWHATPDGSGGFHIFEEHGGGGGSDGGGCVNVLLAVVATVFINKGLNYAGVDVSLLGNVIIFVISGAVISALLDGESIDINPVAAGFILGILLLIIFGG